MIFYQGKLIKYKELLYIGERIMAWIIKNKTSGPVSINDIKVIIMPNEEIDIEKDVNMMKANYKSAHLDKLIKSGILQEIKNEEKEVAAMSVENPEINQKLSNFIISDEFKEILKKSIISIIQESKEDPDKNIINEISNMLNEFKKSFGNIHIPSTNQENIASKINTDEIIAQIHSSRYENKKYNENTVKIEEKTSEDANIDTLADMLKKTIEG
jgi:hypothetical protein